MHLPIAHCLVPGGCLYCRLQIVHCSLFIDRLTEMIYVTQLIYIKEGQQKVFDEFEKVAMPLISKYNGKLLLRLRPEEKAFIESHMEKPYEIHFVEFESDNDLENFMNDKERRKFLHLKEQSIQSSVLIKGTKL